jgi:hypothetical protein
MGMAVEPTQPLSVLLDREPAIVGNPVSSAMDQKSSSSRPGVMSALARIPEVETGP